MRYWFVILRKQILDLFHLSSFQAVACSWSRLSDFVIWAIQALYDESMCSSRHQNRKMSALIGTFIWEVSIRHSRPLPIGDLSRWMFNGSPHWASSLCLLFHLSSFQIILSSFGGQFTSRHSRLYSLLVEIPPSCKLLRYFRPSKFACMVFFSLVTIGTILPFFWVNACWYPIIPWPQAGFWSTIITPRHCPESDSLFLTNQDLRSRF